MSAVTELQTRLDKMKETGLSDMRFHVGETSDSTVESFCAEVLMILDAIDEKRELEYLNEHHALTETYIGIVGMQLNRGQLVATKKSLRTLIGKLDQLTIQYHPASARMMGLTKEPSDTGH